jgi:hypothetical protein
MLLEWGRLVRSYGADQLLDDLAWPGITIEAIIGENGGSTSKSDLTLPERALARMSGYERVAITVGTFINTLPAPQPQLLRLWYVHQFDVIEIASRIQKARSGVYRLRDSALTEIWLIMKLRLPEPSGDGYDGDDEVRTDVAAYLSEVIDE